MLFLSIFQRRFTLNYVELLQYIATSYAIPTYHRRNLGCFVFEQAIRVMDVVILAPVLLNDQEVIAMNAIPIPENLVLFCPVEILCMFQ